MGNEKLNIRTKSRWDLYHKPFRDLYHKSIDQKGRIIIPLALRKLLKPEDNKSFICVRARGGAIAAYTPTDWQFYINEFFKLPETQERRRFARMMYDAVMECPLDNKGGITLSLKLIELAGIKNKVILLDVHTTLKIFDQITFEIWDPQRLSEKCEMILEFNG